MKILISGLFCFLIFISGCSVNVSKEMISSIKINVVNDQIINIAYKKPKDGYGVDTYNCSMSPDGKRIFLPISQKPDVLIDLETHAITLFENDGICRWMDENFLMARYDDEESGDFGIRVIDAETTAEVFSFSIKNQLPETVRIEDRFVGLAYCKATEQFVLLTAEKMNPFIVIYVFSDNGTLAKTIETEIPAKPAEDVGVWMEQHIKSDADGNLYFIAKFAENHHKRHCIVNLKTGEPVDMGDVRFAVPENGKIYGFCVDGKSWTMGEYEIENNKMVLVNPITDYVTALENQGISPKFINTHRLNDYFTFYKDGSMAFGPVFTSDENGRVNDFGNLYFLDPKGVIKSSIALSSSDYYDVFPLGVDAFGRLIFNSYNLLS